MAESVSLRFTTVGNGLTRITAARVDAVGNVPLHVEMATARKKNTSGKLKRRLPKVPPVFLRKYIIQNYVDRLQKEIIGRMKTATQLLIIDQLPTIEAAVEHQHPQGLNKRTDSWSDDVQSQITALSRQYDILADQSASISAGAFNQINELSHKQWYQTAKKVMGVDLLKYEPWISDSAKSFVQTNVGLVKKASSDTLHDINRIVNQGFAQGERWETLRDRIMGTNLTTDAVGKIFPSLESRAELIARDQSLKLYGNLNKQRQTNTGLVWYVWRTVEDERVRGDPSGKYPNARPSHFVMDGKICRWDNPHVYADSVEAAEKNDWKKRASIRGVLLHPNEDFQCLIGSEKIFAFGNYEILYRRRYTGKLTTIVTDSGERFLATPNHPILTADGWKAIDMVNEGDNILKTVFKDADGTLIKPDDFMIPFDQVFQFVSIVGLFQKAGTRRQFHKDGTDKKVDIVSIERFLPAKGNVFFSQKFCKKIFAVANLKRFQFSGKRQLPQLLKTLSISANSDVRGMGKFFSLLWGSISHSNKQCFALISRINSELKKDSHNYAATDLDYFGNFLDTFSAFKKGSYSDFINLFFIMWRVTFPFTCINSMNAEKLGKIASVDLQNIGNIFKNQSFGYKTLRVLKKFRRKFSGHVYNLQSENGFYNINNAIVVRNCRCSGEAVFDTLFMEGNGSTEQPPGPPPPTLAPPISAIPYFPTPEDMAKE